MDIIISANEGIKKMIREIRLDEDNKVSPEKFQNMIIAIFDCKENDEV